MSRIIAPVILTIAAVATVSGCAAGPADGDVTASCNAARTHLTAIGALVDSPSISAGDREDQALDTTTAEQIVADTDRLAGSLHNSEVAAAFGPGRESLLAFAKTIAVEGNVPADIEAAKQNLDSAGADLMRVCADDGARLTASTAKVASGNAAAMPGSPGYITFTPTLAVGSSASGEITNTATGKTGDWTVHVDSASGMFLKVASWGHDFVVTLDTEVPGTYYFIDESLDRYELAVTNTSYAHTMYYSSSRPGITSLHIDPYAGQYSGMESGS